MAIDMIKGDASTCSSPRVSFSHDFPVTYPTQNQEFDFIELDPNSGFNFCVNSFAENEPSTADELFFNGMIIPIQMREKIDSINGMLKEQEEEEEEITATTTATLVREGKSQSKSFWRFRRSSSLNCDSNYGHKRRPIWSLPLLLRSKSTGSSANNSQNDSKQNHKAISSSSKSMKDNHGVRFSSSSSSLTASNTRLPNYSQKPPLKKSGYGVGGGSYVNCVRNSPVLNVPHPYIAKGTSDLLGLGSFFGNGSKDKKSTKWSPI